MGRLVGIFFTFSKNISKNISKIERKKNCAMKDTKTAKEMIFFAIKHIKTANFSFCNDTC
jgi:hypothetical protein